MSKCLSLYSVHSMMWFPC